MPLRSTKSAVGYPVVSPQDLTDCGEREVQQKETLMKIDTRSITLAATLTAMCFVTGLLPYVFFLPVTVAATTLSVGITAFVGLAFGAVSIGYSFLMPTGGVAAAAFIQAPYIAVIPRVVAALGAFGAYKLICRLAKPSRRAGKFASVSVASAVGSLLNTALVVGLFVLVMPDLPVGNVTMILAVPQMLLNGAIECVCMATVTPPIALTLNKVVLRGDRMQKPKPTADNR